MTKNLGPLYYLQRATSICINFPQHSSPLLGSGAKKNSTFQHPLNLAKGITFNLRGTQIMLNIFKWKHFESEIILLCVRWYLKYPLSYRNLAEMMAERCLSISHTTILRLGSAVFTYY